MVEREIPLVVKRLATVRAAAPTSFKRRRLFVTAVAVVASTLVAWASSAVAASHTPGRGISFLDDDLVLGGYLKLEFEALDESRDRFIVEDVSAFLTYKLSANVRLFSEAELEDLISVDDDGLDGGSDVFRLERLYLEYETKAPLRLRLGKVLTPVGIWNPIHAAPLVWTSSRPLASSALFDTGLTGIQADVSARVGELDAVFTGFGQVTSQLDETHDRQDIRRGGGGRMQIGSIGSWQLGTSYIRFDDDTDHRWESVFAADFLFESDDWELSSELAVNDPRGGGGTTWAFYFQAVRHLTARIHPVVRYEHAKLAEGSGNPLVIGVAYKPTPTTVLKAEALLSTGNLPTGGNGFLASFAMLF